MSFELSFDVIFVGGGPASLAGALHLKRLAKTDPKLSGMTVAVIEKAPNLGDHSLSGAALDPRALAELMPDWRSRDIPFGTKVSRERLWYLTRNHHIPAPLVPPPMSNHGKYIISLAEFVRWLGGHCEAEGVEIFSGEAVDELIQDERGAVIGVRIKGKGCDKEGKQKSNYLPPTDIGARIVVLGEGARGHLTRRLVESQGLDEHCLPQGYAVGIKELWEVDPKHFREGTIVNTMGHPLDAKTFGGSFIYHLRDRHVAAGLVVSLDWKDPRTYPYELFQRWKAHPAIRPLFESGRMLSYGARTIAEGGFYCIPRTYGDGFLIIGESAGFLNAMKLKGIDLAMKSGMLAAETAIDALRVDDCSAAKLSVYDERVRGSWMAKGLKLARNFHQGFHGGLIGGMINASLGILTGGRGLHDRIPVPSDADCTKELSQVKAHKEPPFVPDDKVTFDRTTCVFASGTKHEEDQPCHILVDDTSICNGRCKQEYGNPCQFFCPAGVFEMVEEADGVTRLHLNPSNCVHCKTCDIKDPYKIVTWVPPEGGGGPNYKGM